MTGKAIELIPVRYVFLLIVLLVASPFSGLSVQAEQSSPRHAFMWSMRGKGCTVSLLGSIHVLKKNTADLLDDRIEKAYSSCPRVVFEADMDEAGTEKARGMMLRLGSYPKGQTLRQNLSAKTYRILDERLKSSGMEISRFEQLKPWLVSVTLAAIELKRLGFTAEEGIDGHFLKKARADSKKVIFLESAEEQINLLARMLSDRQEELLKQSIEELDVIQQRSAELEHAWREGNVALVETITKTSLKAYPDIEQNLFTERNAAWATKIEKLLSEKGDVFMVVGAAHLVGSNGLLELLRRKGYEPLQD
jgi:uncharacterized protein YbaP (TraB family)